MFTLYYNGNVKSQDVEDGDRIQIETDRIMGDYECANCGEAFEELNEDELSPCCLSEDYQEARGPESFINSASIDLHGDEVHVGISCGDPRGAFVMTLRKRPDGELVLHVPNQGESFPHIGTRELSPGTLLLTHEANPPRQPEFSAEEWETLAALVDAEQAHDPESRHLSALPDSLCPKLGEAAKQARKAEALCAS